MHKAKILLKQHNKLQNNWTSRNHVAHIYNCRTFFIDSCSGEFDSYIVYIPQNMYD